MGHAISLRDQRLLDNTVAFTVTLKQNPDSDNQVPPSFSSLLSSFLL